MNAPAAQMTPIDLVDDYNDRMNSLPEVYENYLSAKKALEMSCSVMGTYGGQIWRGHAGSDPVPSDIQKALRSSAWKRVYALSLIHI